MDELYDTSLTAEHWIDSKGNRLALGSINVEEDELLDPELLRAVDPEEDFEGYTGNAGMTLDRWYRHAAIFLWPNRRHFDVLCDAGTSSAVEALQRLVDQWRQSSQKDSALHADCIAFATKIMARWQADPDDGGFGHHAEPSPLLPLLVVLEEPGLIKAYLSEVLPGDTSIDPGPSLRKVCEQYGWQ